MLCLCHVTYLRGGTADPETQAHDVVSGDNRKLLRFIKVIYGKGDVPAHEGVEQEIVEDQPRKAPSTSQA